MGLSGTLAAQNEGTLWGVVQDVERNPIENVLVTVEASGKNGVTRTDGAYELKLQAGVPQNVYFQHLSHKDTMIVVTLKKGEKLRLDMQLLSTGKQLDVVSVRAVHSDGMVRVDPKWTTKIPSISGGIESLIKLLGASGNNEFSSQYNVRGGNFDENLIYVNDIQIYRPILIHNAQQEGLSFVNTDLTSGVSFSAGGFEAKYGDKMSSVLDVEYKKPVGYGGSVSGSLLGASGHVEGKVNNTKDTNSTFSFLAGIRYKNNSLMLKAMETNAEYYPNMVDFQMLLDWNITKKFSISLLANLSSTQYQFIPLETKITWGGWEKTKRFTAYYEGQEVDAYSTYLGGLTFRYVPNARDQYRLILSSYYAQERETYDILSEYWLNEVEVHFGRDSVGQLGPLLGAGSYLEHARNNLTAVISAADLRGDHKLRSNTVMWGLKVQNEIIKDHISEWKMKDSAGYTLPHLSTMPGDSVPLDDPSRLLMFDDNYVVRADNSLNTIRFTGFIQDIWRIDGDSATRFTLNAGVRFHYWSYNNEFIVSPRLVFIYKPRWKHNWQFLLKTGLYYQPAFYREMRDKTGVLNKDIKSQRSFQVIAGAEYNFKMWKRPFRFTTEIYYKYMDRLIPYIVDNMKITYSGRNESKGYATGIEMRLSGEFIRDLESWITISLMDTREDIFGDSYIDTNGVVHYPGYIKRPTNQLFSISVFFQDKMPFLPQLRVNLNIVFGSGFTYGAPNAPKYLHKLSSSWYRRVDIGFAYMFLEQGRDRMKHKSKFLRAVKNLGLYFEVYNILGISNVSSFQWISDYENKYYPVPNYLTPRLINLRLVAEF